MVKALSHHRIAIALVFGRHGNFIFLFFYHLPGLVIRRVLLLPRWYPGTIKNQTGGFESSDRLEVGSRQGQESIEHKNEEEDTSRPLHHFPVPGCTDEAG